MSIEILGVRIDPLTHTEALGVIDNLLQSNVPRYIVTVNPEFIIAAQTDTEFRGILNRADLALADGIGILWASSFLAEPLSIAATKSARVRWWWCARTAVLKALILLLFPRWIRGGIPERLSGSDLVPKLVKRYQIRIALIGGKNGVAQRAANALVERFPTTHIVLADQGIECFIDSDGYLRYDREAQQQLLLKIRDARPDIVFVAFGQRKQEKWIAENFRHLQGIKLFLGVGGTFDMLAGVTTRAPKFFRVHGIEWVWRWGLEPWRASRMINATVRFISHVLKEKYRRGGL